MQDSARFGQAFGQVSRQPSWVLKLAVLSALLVVVVPIILLVVAAFVVAVVVYLLGSLLARILGLFSLGRGRDVSSQQPDAQSADPDRENVRVIRP